MCLLSGYFHYPFNQNDLDDVESIIGKLIQMRIIYGAAYLERVLIVSDFVL